MPEKILDCSSVSQTYASLENIVGIPEHDLRNFIRARNLDSLHAANDGGQYPGYLFLETLGKTFNPTLNFNATVWFHLTRVTSDTGFGEGILPLCEAIDSIWKFLFGLASQFSVSSQQWAEFRIKMESCSVGHFSELYGHKMDSEVGPFAILVRDAAFCSQDIGNHDYLKTPEIVEDICETFNELHSINLMPEFLKATQPCIVKFRDTETRPYYVGIALYYLYLSETKESLTDEASYCFDGAGARITYDQILDIEFLPEYHTS